MIGKRDAEEVVENPVESKKKHKAVNVEKEEETMKSASVGVKSESVADANQDENDSSEDSGSEESDSDDYDSEEEMDPFEAYECECEAYKCPCGKGSIVLRESYQERSLGKLYYACPRSKPKKKSYGCGYFMWKDDHDLKLRKWFPHGRSTPQVSSPGPTDCSNCKLKDLRIKTLEERVKMLETRLEMERQPEDHACQSAPMLLELLNDKAKDC